MTKRGPLADPPSVALAIAKEPPYEMVAKPVADHVDQHSGRTPIAGAGEGLGRQVSRHGRGNHWGNWFRPEPDQVPKLEAWTCIEWRVKTNTAGRNDGELDCWIDGRKCGEFREINWRSDPGLKVNKVYLSLWLEPQSYARAGGGATRTVWYDDVVVATKYIGPKAP